MSKVVVRCAALEIVSVFACGLLIGRYVIPNVQPESDGVVSTPSKKKRSVKFEDGKLIIDIFK